MPKRKLTGEIVSDKMERTAVVEVRSLKQHPKYRRFFRVSKRYKADNAQNQYKAGEQVVIEEAKPMSKDKRWKIIGKAS